MCIFLPGTRVMEMVVGLMLLEVHNHIIEIVTPGRKALFLVCV